MKTQIIKKATVKKPDFKIGEKITFRYQVPLQNIGWTYEKGIGIIDKVNRVTVNVLDDKGNLWKVDKYDVVND